LLRCASQISDYAGRYVSKALQGKSIMMISDINYYNDDFLKTSVIASLCRDSLKMLQAVFHIKKTDEIRLHFSKFKKTAPYLNPDFINLSNRIYDELLLDDVKIISAFENFFKAVLLESGFIFHETKNIKIPVKIIPDSQNDINLKKTTYGISNFLRDNFWTIYGLPKSDKTYISGIRDRRNSIHLLTSKPSYSPFGLLEEIEVLRPLINKQIAVKYKEYYKKIGVKHNTELVNFDFFN
jgi:hypothetical protein